MRSVLLEALRQPLALVHLSHHPRASGIPLGRTEAKRRDEVGPTMRAFVAPAGAPGRRIAPVDHARRGRHRPAPVEDVDISSLDHALTDVRKLAKRLGHPQLRAQLKAVTRGGGTAGGSCGGRVPHRAAAVGYMPDDRSRPRRGHADPSPARSRMQTEAVVIDQLAMRPVAPTSARQPWGSSSRPRPRSRRRPGR
jgi:hypothetical protein